MKKIIIIILFVIGVSYIFANCDMIAMLAKEGNTISQFGNSSGTYEYPLDFFEYLMQRSINSGTKANPNGYGVIFYHSNSTIITYDPTNLFNEDNEAWYLVDWNNNSDNYYHGTEYTTGFDDNDALNQAYDVILNQHGCENTEASIVLGHARKGTTGTGSHPFRFNLGDKTFTFIQNGGLENGINPNEPNIKLALHTELNSLGWFSNHSFNWIDDPANAGIDQFIDSELLFHWIMKNIIDNNGSVLEGCNRALTATVNGIDLSQELLTPYGYHDWINCVNFVLSDGEKLYVFRNSESEDPDNDIWHNLSYSDLDEFYAIKTYGTELSTRIDQYDMVCFSKDEDPIEYPNFLDIDIHMLDKGYNWVSFPRLDRDETINEEADIVTVLDNNITPSNFTYLAMETNDDTPFAELIYDDEVWDPDHFYAPSSWLCKIMATPEEERVLKVYGSRLDENLILDSSNDDRFPLAEYEYHWIGYWPQESKNIVDALANCWDDIERVKAEDWFYDKCINNRGIEDPQPVSWSPEGKTMEYGKGYMIWFRQGSDPIASFQWGEGGTVEEPETKTESENFTYTELHDYEVIDVVDIPENVVEIGVFQEDTCVGAVVVTGSCEQILVYSDNLSREPLPYNFEVITNNRSINLPVEDYQVYNKNTGDFEVGCVVSGWQEASVIKFGEMGEPQNSIPVIDEVQLHNNYPNPFNPETNISFSIPTDQKIKLNIYNMKGQKVKELINGQFVSGSHSVVWNGKDDTGKQVGSGLYFYKLKTNDKEISKKMLLIK